MEDSVYQSLKVNIQNLYRINLDHYKDKQMKRRLNSWLVRSGYSDWSGYFEHVNRDETENRRFRDYLTINVSSFLRDPERWVTLQEEILPELIKYKDNGRPGGGLKLWSAGCSIGAEPYSLVFLLDELNRKNSYHLLATDIDRGAMKFAADGGPYRKEDVKNLSPDRLNKYFAASTAPFQVRSEYISRVTFKELDLINDPFEDQFDLIICRNVVIYFTADTKRILFEKFRNALRPGGILFVGGTEIIPQARELGLKSVGISLYQRQEES